MNRSQLDQQRLELNAAIAALPVPSCNNCEHYGGGKCDKYGPVPEDFKPKGCAEWEHMEIPF